MNTLTRTVCIALLGSLLVACATGGQSGPDDVWRHTWQVEDISQGGIIDNSMVTLALTDDGRVSGSTGCNRYFGNVSLGSDTFSVSGIGSTRRACAPALMMQETRFLDALQSTRRFELDSHTRLILIDEHGTPRLTLIRLETAGETLASERDPIDSAPDSVTKFSCSEGPDFMVRFLGPETVQISIADRNHILQRERTASGARYLGDGIDFWNKGAEASLEIGGQVYHCLRKDPAD